MKKKKNKKQSRSHKHQTTQQEKKKESATSHGASRKRLREPEWRSTKKGMATDDFQIGRMGFHLTGKKGKKEELLNRGIKKGMTSAHPKIGNQPWTFREIKAEKKGRMKKQGIEPTK